MLKCGANIMAYLCNSNDIQKARGITSKHPEGSRNEQQASQNFSKNKNQGLLLVQNKYFFCSEVFRNIWKYSEVFGIVKTHLSALLKGLLFIPALLGTKNICFHLIPAQP